MRANHASVIRHLKKLKPTDGWTIEDKGTSGFRLHRRNIPLTDNFFLGIYHDANDSGCVVGILTKPRSGTDKAFAQVLVNATGKPARMTPRKTMSVRGWSSSSFSTIRFSCSAFSVSLVFVLGVER